MCCLAILPREVSKKERISQMLKKVHHFLKEYHEIVADEFLVGLPSVRSMPHQIDLNPGSSLPNKAPYQMTPSKSSEVNRQVQEFLDRGLIHEILSPYSTNKSDT